MQNDQLDFNLKIAEKNIQKKVDRTSNENHSNLIRYLSSNSNFKRLDLIVSKTFRSNLGNVEKK